MENLAYNNTNKINMSTINTNNNVTALPQNSLNYYIKLFLSGLADNSKSQYISEFNAFFFYTIGKSWQELQWEDLFDTNRIDFSIIQQYQIYLQKEKKLSNKTVNHHINSIQNLFTKLSVYSNGQINSQKLFVFIKNLPENVNHYGALKDEEMEQLFSYVKTEKNKPEIKYVALRLMACTGMRKSAILSLVWGDIVEDYDYTNRLGFYKIKNKHDKTKDITTAIAPIVWKELLLIRPKGYKKEDKVFDINECTLRETFNRFCEKYNLDKEGRNLSLHSIKHMGVLKTLGKSGNDIEIAAKYANHSNPQTTVRSYINKKIDLSNDPSYHFFDKLDLSTIENASKENLIEAIKKCCPEGIQNQICNFLNKQK